MACKRAIEPTQTLKNCVHNYKLGICPSCSALCWPSKGKIEEKVITNLKLRLEAKQHRIHESDRGKGVEM
jgi:hypothetical protein